MDAIAAWHIALVAGGSVREGLRGLYPKLVAWHRHLVTRRDWSALWRVSLLKGARYDDAARWAGSPGPAECRPLLPSPSRPDLPLDRGRRLESPSAPALF